MGKMNKTTFFFLLMLMTLGGAINGQDLFDRTRNDQAPSVLKSPNGLADRVRTISQFNKVDLFTLDARPKSATTVEDVIFLDVDAGSLGLLGNEAVEIDVPVEEGKSFTLQLFPSRTAGAGYRVRDENGNIIGFGGTTRYYQGIIKDDPASLVALTVRNDEMQVVISDAFGNYNLGLLEDKSRYAMFKEFNVPVFPFDCGVDELGTLIPEFNSQPKESQGPSQKSTGSECVKVYIEADYETYQNFGNSTAAVTTFIEGMFNVVTAIYAAENIHIEMSDLTIWTSNDPYGAESNVAAALSYLNNNINSFNGDLFHLVSAIGNTGNFSGIANIYCNDPYCNLTKRTALCQADPFAVSQTQLFYEELPVYSWTVNVFAHEMGHNLGSPHTHACQWGPQEDSAIDGCFNTQGNCSNPGLPGFGEGTIMSYCHINPNVGISLSNGFGPEVGDHIRGQVATAPCLTACSGGGGCVPVVTVEDTTITGLVEASDIIMTEPAVLVDEEATFSAPTVEIGDDFTVNGSALFEILTTGCNL